PKKTLIIYGTADETPTNKEAAKILQQAIRQSWCNVTVHIKTDKDASEEDLRAHHLLLIGRPDSNNVVKRFQAQLPVDFSSRSFRVRGDNYAHPLSAVVVAADNPSNRRYSVVTIAGLSAESTRTAASNLLQNRTAAGNVL